MISAMFGIAPEYGAIGQTGGIDAWLGGEGNFRKDVRGALVEGLYEALKAEVNQRLPDYATWAPWESALLLEAADEASLQEIETRVIRGLA